MINTVMSSDPLVRPSSRRIASLFIKGVPASAAKGQRSYLPALPLSDSLLGKQWSEFAKNVVSSASCSGVWASVFPVSNELPDSHCVWDNCLRFVPEEGVSIAVGARMGTRSRRNEVKVIRTILSGFDDNLEWHELGGGILEFGDVILVPELLLCLIGKRENNVGKTIRSDDEGRERLISFLSRFGIRSEIIRFEGCDKWGGLHLTTMMSLISSEGQSPTLLVKPRGIIDSEKLRRLGFSLLETAPGEGWAANVLRLGENLIFPLGYPETQAMLEESGMGRVMVSDLDEITKTETSTTCMVNLEYRL